MPKKQRIYSVGDIERGDHLIICKGLTGNQHHLLAIQKGCSGCSLNVIHYNSQGKRSKVTKEKLDLSPRKTPIYRINDRPTGMTVDRVIQKAEKLVGLSKFLPEKNTSEEFVKWCLAEINAKERILKVNDIRRGDHVIIRQFMGLHYHHCLAVEDGTEDNRLNVIHFSNCPKLFGEVVRETISLQPEDKPVFRVNIQCGNLSRDVDEVVGKAEKQLGLRKYSTESNNCENFVKWCQTETRYQERICKVTDILKGDHLITKARRGLHRHHSLAVDDGRPGNVVSIVHYTNGRIVEEDLVLDPDERDVFRFIEHKFIDDGLEYADDFTSEDNETDEENAGNAGIDSNDDGNESDDDAEIMFVLTDTDKVIEKARRQLNEHKYSNDFNNCEHFVNWCKHQTGHRERVQGLGYVKKGDHVIIDKFLMEHHVLVVQDGSHMNNNIAVIHYSHGQVIEEQMNIDPSKDNVFLFYDDCPEDEEADQTDDVITQARRQVGMKNYCQNERNSSKHFVFWCKMRRSHREPLYSIADLQKGDHLVIENFRGMKNHHSIVVENSVERRKATIVYHNEDRVIEEEIYVDAEKYKLYCVHDDYYDEDICRDVHENSEKARSSIGQKVYSLENSSNEHFVHWCKRMTEQLKEVKSVQDIKFGDHLIIGTPNKQKPCRHTICFLFKTAIKKLLLYTFATAASSIMLLVMRNYIKITLLPRKYNWTFENREYTLLFMPTKTTRLWTVT
ncbi:uncharacterized protein [Ptychodera flava]|uniref:uncharacterized protein n=1 Tax=Ptychodera flava TaxID=63121 RepID=UPI003969CB3E